MSLGKSLNKTILQAAAALCIATNAMTLSANAQGVASGSGLVSSARGGDVAEVFEETRLAAQAGGPEAQHNLALFYWHGVAVTQNFQEALRWVTLAAVSGHAKARRARPLMVETAGGALAQKAIEWSRERLQQAAESGDDNAILFLLASFSADFGFENMGEAYFWAAIAVSAGKGEALRRRTALVAALKPADVIKLQDRANEWFSRWRPVASSALTR